MHTPSALNSNKQYGLSLLELMVALAISMVVLFAVTAVYLSTKQNTRLQTGMGRINQNAQSTTEILSQEIRQAAFAGCRSLALNARGNKGVADDAIIAESGSNSFTMLPKDAIRAITVPGITGPVIEVLHAASDGAHLSQTMAYRNGSIQLGADPKFPTINATNRPVGLISDCANAELFVVGSVTKPTSTTWQVNPYHVNGFRTRYTQDARVMPVARTRYYVAMDTRPAGEISTLALYRSQQRANGSWANTVPIAHDISSINVLLEIDTNGDFLADEQVPYTGSFETDQIVGMTIVLNFKTPQNIKGTDGNVIERPTTTSINIRARVS